LEAAQYDLVIVGAGPAGSASAITAARAGARVLVLEKDYFPRQKVCGEFVSPESLGLLQDLLPDDRFRLSPRVTSSSIFLDNKFLNLPVSPPARSIPRFDLDVALFEAARLAGATAREGVAVTEVRRNEVFHVVTAADTYKARAVINATGRWSKLTQFDVGENDKWLGLKAHFTEALPPPSVDLYFFAGGYCGVTPVSDHSINACAMVRADVAHTLEEVFARESHLFARSRSWQPLFPTVTTAPLYFREPETESDGMLLAGDAAGFIDPFAGDGISLALQGGTLAAESILPFLRGKCLLAEAHRQYETAYRERFAPVFNNAARLRNALAAPKWVRRAVFALAGTPGVGRMLVRGTRAR
jgi:menaquinone-9 beta-reductase